MLKNIITFWAMLICFNSLSQASFTSSNGMYYFIDPKSSDLSSSTEDVQPFDEFGQSVAKAKFKFESRYVIKSKGTGAYAVDIETVEKKRIYQAILTIDKSIRKSVEEAELSADDAARLLSQYYTIAYDIFPLETVLLENRLKTYKKDVSKLTLELTNFYSSAKKSRADNN
jgi:hypothetical protein